MKPVLVTLLALCAINAALVPKMKRTLNIWPDPPVECNPETPCGWQIYRPFGPLGREVKMVELNITNKYCHCGPNLHCVEDSEDTTVHAFIHRCRPIQNDDE